MQRAVVIFVVPVGLRPQEATKDPGRSVFESGVKDQKHGRVDEGVSETDVQGHLMPGRVLWWADGSQTPPFFCRSATKDNHQKERSPEQGVN